MLFSEKRKSDQKCEDDSDYGSEDIESEIKDDQVEIKCDFCSNSKIEKGVTADYEYCDYCYKRSKIDKTPVFSCRNCAYEGCMNCYNNKL